MLNLKKINIFNDRSPNDVVFTRIVDFFSIENTILFVTFDLDPDDKKTKPAISGSKYTSLTIRNLDDINIDFIQKNMFRVDMVAFMIDEWPYDHILEEVMQISTRLNVTCLLDIPANFNKRDAEQLDYALFSLEKKERKFTTIKDLTRDSDKYYLICDEITGEKYSFQDYKTSLFRDKKIDDIID